MTITIIQHEIIKYVRSLNILDIVEQNMLVNQIYAFICNAKGKNRRNLLEIIKKVEWYSNDEVYAVIKKGIRSLFDGQDYLFLKFKCKLSSSSNKYLSMLSTEGYISESEILDVRSSTSIVVPEETTIVIIDDFIGTGDTVFTHAIDKIRNKNKIIVICHSVSNEGLVRLKSDGRIILRESEIIISQKYKSKITDSHQLNLIDFVCKRCSSESYKFGYGNLQLMVCFESIVPNNTISMLWWNHFNSPLENWMSIYNRSMNIEVKEMLRNKIFENTKELFDYYNEILDQVSITFPEFLVVIAIRMNTYNVVSLMKLLKIDSKSELRGIINELLRKNYIKKSLYDLEIESKLNDYISKFIKKSLTKQGETIGFIV